MSVQNKTTQQVSKAQMCRSCKSFYGCESFEWLCSKCYNKTKKNTKQETNKQQPKKNQQNKQQKQQKPTRPIQQNKNRCYTCRKKTGLLGIQCKCGYFYCNSHRLPQDHQCDFNHEQDGKQKLKKQIIKVSHQKIQGV